MDFRFLHKKQTAKPTSKPVPHLVCHDQESGVDIQRGSKLGLKVPRFQCQCFKGFLGFFLLTHKYQLFLGSIFWDFPLVGGTLGFGYIQM